jgi:hypothetical protein
MWAGLGLILATVFIPAANAQVEGQPDFHLYLLAGQSNMAGRGVVAAEDTVRHPRVYALSDSMTWRLAYEPLHFDKPKLIGVGPGFAFGKAMAEADTSALIGLIPAAVGGSPIESWSPGKVHEQTNSRPYDDALSRVFRVLALYGGTLRGIIWHQGEANRETDPDQYSEALSGLIDRFRSDFQHPDLPFVAAPLAPFFVAQYPNAARINSVINSLPDWVEQTAVVRSDDLKAKDDKVHLDAASARLLGKRYARAMLKLGQLSEQ